MEIARFDRSSMTAFGQWFTWCQACRHGGHADHINDVTVLPHDHPLHTAR
jgi:hypothetical protein